MKEKLVTVAHFMDYLEADLARQSLESAGITAFVMGQNVGTVYSGVPAVVDIELQTPDSQAAEARKILESRRQQEPQDKDMGRVEDSDRESDLDLHGYEQQE